MTTGSPNLVVQRGRAAWHWLAERLWLLLPLFVLGALWPFYAQGLPRSYDGTLHLLRIRMLDHQIDLHLASPTQDMVAQQDGQPQAGANPTWSWQPGEVVVDSMVLQTQTDAAAGRYTLFVGFYDPQTEGRRLSLVQADGTAVLDNRAPFSEIVID